MTVLYTNGNFTDLSPAAFNTYATIQVSPTDATSAVLLGLSSAGTINFSPKVGLRSAEVDGSLGNDNITTGAGEDSLWGNAGNDTLSGGAGNDLLVGDWNNLATTGNDLIYGGTGSDKSAGRVGQ